MVFGKERFISCGHATIAEFVICGGGAGSGAVDCGVVTLNVFVNDSFGSLP